MCAPSNVAVDQLAEKISATGLKVTEQYFACNSTNSMVSLCISWIEFSLLFLVSVFKFGVRTHNWVYLIKEM